MLWGCCEFNDCGYKCFLQSHTLWTWEAGTHPCHLYPSSLNLFPWLPSTGCSQHSLNTPAPLPCFHLMPSTQCLRSNFQLVIDKKWGEASWMGGSGTTPSWAKSTFKLAFFIMIVSNSATFNPRLSFMNNNSCLVILEYLLLDFWEPSHQVESQATRWALM